MWPIRLCVMVMKHCQTMHCIQNPLYVTSCFYTLFKTFALLRSLSHFSNWLPLRWNRRWVVFLSKPKEFRTKKGGLRNRDRLWKGIISTKTTRLRFTKSNRLVIDASARRFSASQDVVPLLEHKRYILQRRPKLLCCDYGTAGSRFLLGSCLIRSCT